MAEHSPSHPHADRNLLFGILALQMDFISRDSLIAAMGAWVLNKDKALGQILDDQGKMSPEHLALLEPLVQAHIKAHGDDPHKSLASLSDLGSVREQLLQIPDPDLLASLATFPPNKQTAEQESRSLRAYVGIATAAAVLAFTTIALAVVAFLLVAREKDATRHRHEAEKQLDDARLNAYALGLNWLNVPWKIQISIRHANYWMRLPNK
jgi:hypothetical protein